MKIFKNKFLLIFFVLIFTVFSSCSQNESETINQSTPANPSELSVYFLDVGQADSAFIELNGKTMLIDGGNVDDSSLIYSFLKKHDIKKIDYIVASHAHEDHMGGLNGAIKNFDVGKIYASTKKSDAKFYKNFEKLTQEKSIEIIYPKTNDFFMLSDCIVEFFVPTYTENDEVNNTSIMTKLSYANVSFLFTGDSEREAEKNVINQGVNLKADVLKVGHHGAYTSSSYEFLRSVMPEISVISVGNGNSYGHPSEDTLSRFNDLGSLIYRTDKDGDIKITTDGKSIKTQTSKNKEGTLTLEKENQNQNTDITYIGNINSKKLHIKSCNFLPMEKNRIYFNSYETAIKDGYSPCSNCIN